MAIVKTHLGNIRGPQGVQGIQGERGLQGEPFTYEDFTEEQLQDMAQRTAAIVLEVASICYVSTAIPTADVGKDGDFCVVTG